MRKLTANDICDYDVEITEMDGHEAYGWITSAYSNDPNDNEPLTDEELESKKKVITKVIKKNTKNVTKTN